MKGLVITGKSLLSKARNLFAKAVGQPITKPEEPKPFQRQASDIVKYIYLNPGLSRHERRALNARIARKGINKKDRERPGVKPQERETAKWQLKNTPINVPATFRRLAENIKRKFAGEPIKVWSR